MSRAPAYRGQPLIALMLIIGGWVAMRMMVWDAAALDRPVTAGPMVVASAPAAPASSSPALAAASPALFMPVGAVPPPPRGAVSATGPGITPWPAVRSRPAPLMPLRGPPPLRAPPPAASVTPRLTVAHQMLWMAALAQLPLPPSAWLPAPTPQRPLVPASAPSGSPWSGDAWLLLRRGGNVSAVSGFVPATYGASQAGAVVRYRLVPDSANRPSLYLRASAALNGSREREAALGVSARPLARVPLVAAAEARVNDQPGATHVRPAAFVYTELAPLALPHGLRVQFYGQAGYVGGNFASAFADGQLRVDRRLARIGQGELRAGGGAWGGAQKGAARLDVGPAATLGMPLGGSVGATVGVDWRFRVAGKAAPTSGPALTLSAGF